MLAALGISDRVADAVALEGATLRFDKGLRSFWRTARRLSADRVRRVRATRCWFRSCSWRAAIVSDPDDEQARLAYARAIGATDPARAEFIEIQRQLAHVAQGARAAGRLGQSFDLRQRPLSHGSTARAGQPTCARSSTAYDVLARLRRGSHRCPQRDSSRTAARALSARADPAPEPDRRPRGRRRSCSRRRTSRGSRSLGLVRQRARRRRGRRCSPSRVQLGNLTWLHLEHTTRSATPGSRRSRPRTACRSCATSPSRATRRPIRRPSTPTSTITDSDVAKELQAKYGPRPWLSAAPRGQWPPPRDAA